MCSTSPSPTISSSSPILPLRQVCTTWSSQTLTDAERRSPMRWRWWIHRQGDGRAFAPAPGGQWPVCTRQCTRHALHPSSCGHTGTSRASRLAQRRRQPRCRGRQQGGVTGCCGLLKPGAVKVCGGNCPQARYLPPKPSALKPPRPLGPMGTSATLQGYATGDRRGTFQVPPLTWKTTRSVIL